MLVERYWRELLDALHGEGFQVLHLLLDAAPDALLRIQGDSAFLKRAAFVREGVFTKYLGGAHDVYRYVLRRPSS